MSRRLQENIVACVLLIVFVGYLLTALTFGPNARLVPLPMAVLGIVLLVTQLIRQNIRDAGELHVDLFASLTGAPVESAPEAESSSADEQLRRELRAAVFVAVFVGLIVGLGPIVAVFLFSTGFLALTHHYAPVKALAVGGAFTTALYILFVLGLQLQLYHGILEPLFAP